MIYIVKRDGRKDPFNERKIKNAIFKAFEEVDGEISEYAEEKASKIANYIYNKAINEDIEFSVEEIQDLVEDGLMRTKRKDVAKAYINYRHDRTLKRGNIIDKTIEEIASGTSEYWSKENSNKKFKIVTTQRDYFAGALSEDYSKRKLLPLDIVKAHEEAIIHFHDIDYFAQNVLNNCCLINLEDMLQNNTVINEVLIETPHKFLTASTIATQIILGVSSSQYGGCTVSLSHLAPFVRYSFIGYLKDSVDYIDADINLINELVEDENFDYDNIKVKVPRNYKYAMKHLIKDINAGVQTFNYQVNSMSNTNGQAPFLSVNMYLGETEEYKYELALIIEEFLNQRILGLKNKDGIYVTPAFPKLLYVLEEDNMHEDSKYYYLTELAAKCTAKRMVPDYISEKIMKEYKIDENGEGHCYPCMGCVDGAELITYKIDDKLYVESFERTWDRFSSMFEVKKQFNIENNCNLYMDLDNVSIYDTKEGKFTKCYRIIRNVSDKWVDVNMSGGRRLLCTNDHPFETLNRGIVRAEDLVAGDKVLANYNQYSEEKYAVVDIESINKFVSTILDKDNTDPHFPEDVFEWTRSSRLAFLNSIVDNIGYIDTSKSITNVEFSNKGLALEVLALAQSFGYKAKLYYVYNSQNPTDIEKYRVEFITSIESDIDESSVIEVISITNMDMNAYSYDVTTESEHFEVSGIYSHNCRSFLTPYIDKNGKPKYYGRLNCGVVTLNLPDIALSSGGDLDKFWEIFDERTELCHRALRIRYDRVADATSDVAPILWQDGAFGRLKPGEKIGNLIKDGYATVSLGYAGLYETVLYMTGESHSGGKGKEFGLKLMQALNDKCNEWKVEEHIAYSLYGSPIESTTYKFAKNLRRRFGIIKDITDRDYITNSYHINVREQIDAFSKLKIESEYQKLSPGGAISYVEVPNMQDNIPAVISVLKFIYNNIMYAELNTKSDYCMECGYDGEMEIKEDDNKNLFWECPNCGCHDETKIYVTRRTCGYIGTQFWNQGRTQEIKDRVLHL